ncbi:MAG TPA: prolyl oligopeptidase family serine peptidase [Acidimicrobiales bacterium]|nr:prolyl oligopeptidase family serine peptidase [Acidimicrobiales bacterium]
MPDLHPVVTRRGSQVDNYHGDTVADPYRWLEDTDDPETAVWVKQQNDLTEAYLAGVSSRETVRARLTEIWDYPKYSAPFERGGRWFQYRNSGLQDQPVLYVMASPAGEAGQVLLDPNGLSPDGTVAVTSVSVSDDGSLLAYATSAAGSDWMTWRAREVASKADRPDLVEWSKFGVAAWAKDGTGFYYSGADRPQAGQEYTGKLAAPRVMFHRLGTAQSEDQVVLDTRHEPEWLPHGQVSEDGQYLVVTTSIGTAPEIRVDVLDLSAQQPGKDGNFVPLVGDFSSLMHYVTNVGTVFYFVTDHQAGRRRLVAIDLRRPARDNWREVVGEQEALLVEAAHCGGRLVCHYLQDACSRLRVFELDGSPVRDVDLPAVASIVRDGDSAGIEGRARSELVHFEVASFIDSGTLWSHNVSTGATEVLRPASAPIKPSDYVSERVFVTAGDGARLPLFLTRRRDLEPDGNAPVLLYAYGGFNIPIVPKFDRAGFVFAERGGIFAVAVLRGGGEYGRPWHDAGRRAVKQRVFDDFCDCARWVALSGWSRPGRVAINGRSNGGLLVGACLTQHPELFGAAVPEVGVMDMLRFHKFTIGWAWKSDFGDPDDPEQYQWARAYSPLHNIKEGTAYPPTLVLTGDHDDRVVPGHSFKFAAALQAAQAPSSGAPVLIRVETSAGHGFGMPTSKAIAHDADILAFLDATVAAADAGRWQRS